MRLFKHVSVALAVIVGSSAWVGCGAGGDVSVEADAIKGAEGKGPTKSACLPNIFNNQTGKPLTQGELAQLNDPVAHKILGGEDCPTTQTKVANTSPPTTPM